MTICNLRLILIKIPIIFFTEIEKYPNIHMEAKGLWIAKAIPTKKSTGEGITILQSHSNQNNIAMTQKQTLRPKEQNMQK
jgi:hypothetical protein